MTRIVTRACSPVDAEVLTRHGLHPVLARLYASRGVCLPDEIETGLARLTPPAGLKGCGDSAALPARPAIWTSVCCITPSDSKRRNR